LEIIARFPNRLVRIDGIAEASQSKGR
jgi:hypothetical protein